MKGGLGNQLFIYAAARRLSHISNVPLKLDAVSGFRGDFYRREYCLGSFNIKAEPASRIGCYDYPLSRGVRLIARRLNARLPFSRRWYIEEEGDAFDPRLLILRISGRQYPYLDGYWADERYFRDIEAIIRADLQIVAPLNEPTLRLADQIHSCCAVSMHARRLRELPAGSSAKPLPSSKQSLPIEYYSRAVEWIEQRVPNPVFFCFADYPEWFRENIETRRPVVVVENSGRNDQAYQDLWLMSQCRHHIIANSTFSWWGAWLGINPDKLVVSPDEKRPPRWATPVPSWHRINV